MRMALSYELVIESQDRTIPFRSFETGRLRYGIGDPDAEAYDSLTDVHVATAENTIEVRLPWLLLNFRDPSTRRITGDIWQGGLDATERIDSVGIAALTYRPGPDGGAHSVDGDGNHTDSLTTSSIGSPTLAGRYRWDSWQQPEYSERRKRSYDILQRTFADVGQQDV